MELRADSGSPRLKMPAVPWRSRVAARRRKFLAAAELPLRPEILLR